MFKIPLMITIIVSVLKIINAPPPEGAFIRKYENPFVITDEDITEAAPQFTLIEEDDIDINV